ncbi:hypothetical protein EJ377_01925 [Chryseobacterium arthrosphaerae]|uniref:Uncharacterized protein n=1 Tax=Chryseobacterium arthrosphaerae TaxID=651561 RepID=A0A432DYS8_9FLAO|nr:hypothetical protein EJ377_01925 [Chryseobacterium arthrosphaerae]
MEESRHYNQLENAPDSIKNYTMDTSSAQSEYQFKEFEAAERPSIVNDDHYFKADTALLEKKYGTPKLRILMSLKGRRRL